MSSPNNLFDPPPIVVLVRPQGPINVGLCCRAAANMGVQTIRVVQPGPQALNGELGRPFACKATALWEQIAVVDNVHDAVADCELVLGTTRRRRGGRLPQFGPAQAQALRAERAGAWAVLFGSEADGLSEAELMPCDAALVLQMPGDYASLNLSHAVLLGLWSLQAPATAEPKQPFKPPAAQATARQRRALARLLLDGLGEAGFFAQVDRARYEAKLWEVAQTAPLAAGDVQLLSGAVRFLSEQAARAEPPRPAPPSPPANPTP